MLFSLCSVTITFSAVHKSFPKPDPPCFSPIKKGQNTLFLMTHHISKPQLFNFHNAPPQKHYTLPSVTADRPASISRGLSTTNRPSSAEFLLSFMPCHCESARGRACRCDPSKKDDIISFFMIEPHGITSWQGRARVSSAPTASAKTQQPTRKKQTPKYATVNVTGVLWLAFSSL